MWGFHLENEEQSFHRSRREQKVAVKNAGVSLFNSEQVGFLPRESPNSLKLPKTCSISKKILLKMLVVRHRVVHYLFISMVDLLILLPFIGVILLSLIEL